MDQKDCSLCGSQIYPGHGNLYIRNNLNVYRFCRSKCSKLFHLKKNPFFLKWTLFSRKIKGLRLISETQLPEHLTRTFDKNKNYNTQITLQTLYNLKRIKKINHNRKLDYKNIKKFSHLK